ncbi:MAG: hypothetical protein WBQ14_03010 [Gaiellaceae bacterium]
MQEKPLEQFLGTRPALCPLIEETVVARHLAGGEAFCDLLACEDPDGSHPLGLARRKRTLTNLLADRSKDVTDGDSCRGTNECAGRPRYQSDPGARHCSGEVCTGLA